MCPHAQIREYRAIRCILVHEYAFLRDGLRRLLDDEPDLEVVAEAGNAAEALRQILEQQPEIVIADPAIFGCTTYEAEQMILQESPTSRIVFLPRNGEDEVTPLTSLTSKRLLRGASSSELVSLIRASRGQGAGVEMAAPGAIPVDEAASRRRALTAREREVLKLLAEGRTVRSVASILSLSVKTVDAHKFNLMRKLGIHNKAELVMWAIQKKVVKLPVNF